MDFVNSFTFVFGFVPDQYKTKKCVIKLFLKNLFLLKYCLYKYKTHEMCDKAVDAFLPPSEFAPNYFVTKKMLEKLYVLYSLMMI